MLPEELTQALALGYAWALGGGFCLMLVAEVLIPLDAIGSDGERTRHVLNNFFLWLSAVLVAEVLVGGWVLDIPALLSTTSSGPLAMLSLSFPALLVMGILLVDLGEYVFHRLSHSNRWLWLLHAVHHSDDKVDVSTALRFHPGETALNLVWKAGFLWLLGLPLWIVPARALLIVPATLLQHGNIRVPARADRALRWVFVTPALHKIHHSPLASENNTDFGELFSFWDRLFGTLRESAEEKARKYGLTHLSGDGWQTFRGMLATPIAARHLPSL